MIKEIDIMKNNRESSRQEVVVDLINYQNTDLLACL